MCVRHTSDLAYEPGIPSPSLLISFELTTSTIPTFMHRLSISNLRNHCVVMAGGGQAGEQVTNLTSASPSTLYYSLLCCFSPLSQPCHIGKEFFCMPRALCRYPGYFFMFRSIGVFLSRCNHHTIILIAVCLSFAHYTT